MLKYQMIYRSLGPIEGGHRLGAGCIRKSVGGEDESHLTTANFVLVYLMSGSGTYIDEYGQHHRLEPGSCFLRVPDRPHMNIVDSGSDWREGFLEIGRPLFDLLSSMRVIRQFPTVAFIGRNPLMENEFFGIRDRLRDAAEEELPQLLLEILSLLLRVMDLMRLEQHDRSVDEMIREACRYLGDYQDKRYNLRGFCQRRGWGYERFRKIFKRELGIPPGQYRIRRRLDAAMPLLKEQNLALSEIAERLGYGSPFEFSAQFKKYYGISPRQWRRKSNY